MAPRPSPLDSDDQGRRHVASLLTHLARLTGAAEQAGVTVPPATETAMNEALEWLTR
jgi:hypothetical protein